MSRDTRKLQHTKTKTVKSTGNPPSNSEGSDGDIRVSKTNAGVVLYVKYKNKWYATNLLEITDSTITGR